MNGGLTLIIGYGNPGRQDDGLGPEFVRRVDDGNWQGVSTQVNYQLTVEDAVDIARYPRIIFVDATIEPSIATEQGFSFTPVGEASGQPFASHSLTPGSLMELARTLFDARAEAYILAISGYEFDQFEEKLSARAEANLLNALDYCRQWLQRHPVSELESHA
ncbi:hydrogenase maturation protease [Hahella sp. CCB-MM4]|uniref:hydrogenase maturation protease n=1 Tax=Hahella sp. (strain CCB-MM4) TaxID=1926491 RepID=UPI00143D34FF|nr:hydrogenase maturation protease [Hahella sp. CCB-MM4]